MSTITITIDTMALQNGYPMSHAEDGDTVVFFATETAEYAGHKTNNTYAGSLIMDSCNRYGVGYGEVFLTYGEYGSDPITDEDYPGIFTMIQRAGIAHYVALHR